MDYTIETLNKDLKIATIILNDAEKDLLRFNSSNNRESAFNKLELAIIKYINCQMEYSKYNRYDKLELKLEFIKLSEDFKKKISQFKKNFKSI
jgi:hypothetical protein